MNPEQDLCAARYHSAKFQTPCQSLVGSIQNGPTGFDKPVDRWSKLCPPK
jgi:hypothetical protein